MANKYWENEEAIVTETKYAEVHYYKEAGKIQLYGTYKKSDGSLSRTKAAVWDNNEMEADDAVKLAYAIMQGLVDVGIENDAFTEAYEILSNAVDEEANSDGETVEVLDEEFEDEPVDYDNMTISELKIECQAREIAIPKRAVKSKLIELLRSIDGTTSTGKVTSDDFKKAIDSSNDQMYIGKHIIYDGKDIDPKNPDYVGYRKASKRVKDVYIEYMDDCNEWVTYIIERSAELASMPTKTRVQKKKQDEAYSVLKEEVADWVDSWDEVLDEKDVLSISEIANDLMYSNIGIGDVGAMIMLAKIIDKI